MNETSVHRYGVSLHKWQVSLIWSFIVSIFCIGGLLGTLAAAPLITRFGRWVRGAGCGSARLLLFNDALALGCSCFRKRCFLLNNCVTITGAVLMLLSRTAKSFEMIMAARFIYGLSAGEAEQLASAFSVCVLSLISPLIDGFCRYSWTINLHLRLKFFRPSVFHLSISIDSDCSSFTPSGIGLSAHSLYLVECAPKRLRGMVGVTVATFASFGKFLAQLLGIR